MGKYKQCGWAAGVVLAFAAGCHTMSGGCPGGRCSSAAPRAEAAEVFRAASTPPDGCASGKCSPPAAGAAFEAPPGGALSGHGGCASGRCSGR